MIRVQVLFVSLTLVVAGCVDNIDSVSREYRNANNEAMDAMMMVTSERRAEEMTRRIFKPIKDRYAALDKKVEIILGNRTKKEFAKDVLESDGVHIYLSELEVNRERYQLEIMRLKNLVKQILAHEKKLLEAEGNNEDPDPNKVCKTLNEMCNRDEALSEVRKQLTEPKLVKYIEQFPQWKVDLNELAAVFQKKREIFMPRLERPLVN
jgi:hypothetical protein